ncbi:hypothetical protein [Plantactinospora sp. GCM10030261]|uniref:hypothetical protein n=1 Tax=Plantactinospora sp. GCM10030261 TaxID=3273420 RepID=UPI003607DE0C
MTSSTTEPGSQVPSRWTRPLQLLTVVCSVVFVIGTTLHNFLIIDVGTVTEMMRLAGSTPAEAQMSAPGFVTGFRIVGCLYIVGNAIGLLARAGHGWVFWTVLGVNVTQAAGVVAIPPEVFTATRAEFGPAGLLPSLITDGGAAVLTLILVGFLIRYRRPWAYRNAGYQRNGHRPLTR